MNETQVDAFARRCSICEGARIPIIGTYAVICTRGCDGWPPRLEPPTAPKKGAK